ncbi:phosphoribosylformylglycinamidine synthase subunit PurQ [Acetobacter oeni]|uniref:Phosphoribosylformylglycinamidine synthase subunit PurQ n=1 Tax=Acetobacter oeni TaxID=304077 RepID=A0A511XJI7_9PROT|nr:phosphoribosylformylglycinamidine synthase subunit PurQ [Acetobacter oeni]MBB3883316.1 phosphoribosylformylglycinamidine synthase [Acetobacter oeni]NHO19516.1 phosphoribosylformylglycinamidine synthase subunit PurQ [Acetobacter oeni]GBR00860.1 phosphoribosylformylglycinamidine synthase I [Acetobacter oeni LMG 21952]GEN63098.1 phosphoribosylformylglycinamidine synthase subunit PurQ [Acetobacter oeni]
MKAGIVVFPGTNRERDMAIALRSVSGHAPKMLWHRDVTLPDLDLIVLPGGFSYGDYLRCGAMAAHSPIMREIKKFVKRGGYVLGVCNGFQILTETQILPGALLRNAGLRFLSQDCFLRVENERTPFTAGWRKGGVFRAPLAHGDGNYVADDATLGKLEAEGRVVFRYSASSGEVSPGDRDTNPNGSMDAIAGIVSSDGRVCGMMPHPEDLVDPLMGGADGRPLFESLVEAFVR